jgi:hypothetical protein
MAGFVYQQSEPNLWTVGHYDPQGKWQPESDQASDQDAAKRVAWLNGNNASEDTPDYDTTFRFLRRAVLASHMRNHAGISKPGFNQCREGFCAEWHSLFGKKGKIDE